MTGRRWKFNWLWYDMWVGLYYDRDNQKVYIAPLPTLVFSYQRPTKSELIQKRLKRFQAELDEQTRRG